MPNLDLLDGFSYYKNLICILLIEGAENPVADNLSRLENVLDEPLPIDDSFPDEQLVVISASRTAPWYVDYANYNIAKFIPPSFTYQQKKKIL